METLKKEHEVTARKDHSCNFCGEKIRVGEKYSSSTHKFDGKVYDWNTHINCAWIADKLNMYEHADEGVTQDMFGEYIQSEYFHLLITKMAPEDVTKYSEIAQQLRLVNFRNKLQFVVHHYKTIDKINASRNNNLPQLRDRRMKTANMTIQQLIDMCYRHDYVIVRQWDGFEYAVNCKIVTVKSARNKTINVNGVSNISSYRPCNFDQYISYKVGFFQAIGIKKKVK